MVAVFDMPPPLTAESEAALAAEIIPELLILPLFASRWMFSALMLPAFEILPLTTDARTALEASMIPELVMSPLFAKRDTLAPETRPELMRSPFVADAPTLPLIALMLPDTKTA